MTYNVKFIKESIYNNPDFQPKKKKIPSSIATKRITVQVIGCEVDHTKYNLIPKAMYFTAVIRSAPNTNLKELNFEQLTELFNKNVIPPFLPIIDWQEMKFFKDGRLWFKRNKMDFI